MDYSLLDHPTILQVLFYPRQEWYAPPPGASDHMVEVGPGLALSARFYPASPTGPNLLFFHGNGEVAFDYDDTAPLYQREGINLFVADYRGYGRSGGLPDFSSIVKDAVATYPHFRRLLEAQGFTGRRFVMGRSLGAHPALNVALAYPDEISGIIIESGFVEPAHLLRHSRAAASEVEALVRSIAETLSTIRIPALIIHGERDELVPLTQAEFLQRSLGSTQKRLVVIPGAGHNDIMMVGLETYFRSIREFVEHLAE